MDDQPMHLRLKKGMLIRLSSNQKTVIALVVSDVYMIKGMFHMVKIIARGKKKGIRANFVKEIYDDI
jgi:hypothetical protein